MGFRSGLEVHQQLATKEKLFCHCPAGIHKHKHDAELLRHMRPTLSELGEYDGTALMEFKTRKQVHYHLFRDTVCTYEMDDTPPFPINQEALDIAIRIALLFDCTLVDELHVSRKQYLDGSIPTGFQRTAIIGVNGSIPVNGRDVGVIQLALEEDSCREVEDRGHDIVFRTDRLSTPLVEVVTAPDLRTPAEVVEAAEVIRRTLRATKMVRRGAGSTRADVNVSVAGGTRAEIKGVPRINWFERLVRVEACRQRGLLDIREHLKVRGVSERRFQAVISDVTHVCRSFRLPSVRRAVRRGDAIMGVCLPGFGGLLCREIQPGIAFSSEFAGRIRVIACLDEMPNILHTDDETAWQSRERELNRIRNEFSASHVDVVVLVWGPKEDAVTAAEEIRLRALDAIRGVPNETRQAFRSGHSDFERILPGPDRMYPDTDSPPVRIEAARVAELKKNLPQRPDVTMKRLGEMGLSAELASDVLLNESLSLFDDLVEDTSASPVDIAVFVAQLLVSHIRKGKLKENPSYRELELLFSAYQNGGFTREAFRVIADELGSNHSVDKILQIYAPSPAPSGEVDHTIRQVMMDALEGCRTKNREARIRFCMGKAMDHLRGRTPGRALRERFEKELPSQSA
jgi:glutamyl-tRNA(Gln) amidotransferase subunit E